MLIIPAVAHCLDTVSRHRNYQAELQLNKFKEHVHEYR